MNPKKVLEDSAEVLRLKQEIQVFESKNSSLQQAFDNIHSMLEEFFGNSAIYMKNDSTIEMTEAVFAERLKEFIQTLKVFYFQFFQKKTKSNILKNKKKQSFFLVLA